MTVESKEVNIVTFDGPLFYLEPKILTKLTNLWIEKKITEEEYKKRIDLFCDIVDKYGGSDFPLCKKKLYNLIKP